MKLKTIKELRADALDNLGEGMDKLFKASIIKTVDDMYYQMMKPLNCQFCTGPNLKTNTPKYPCNHCANTRTEAVPAHELGIKDE